MRTLFFVLMSLLVFLSGCTNLNEQDALSIAKKFKESQYEIIDFNQLSDDYAIKLTEQLKPYMTEQAYKRFYANRDAGIAAYFAKENKSNITVSSINFKKNSEDKKLKAVVYDFTMELLIKSDMGEKKTNKKGQVTLVQSESTWKIDSQWDEKLEQSDFKQ